MAGGPNVFISYKHAHEGSLALVAELEAALAPSAVTVWRDVGIEPGDRWSDELWRWLMECSAAVVLISSEAAASDWCRREWSVLAARESQAGLRVIPVFVDDPGPSANILAHLQAVEAGPGAAGRIVEHLRDLEAAPLGPADYLAAHRAWLQWQFNHAPALGREPFSLADVYVDTECGVLTWDELSTDRSIDPFDEQHGGRVDLVETVLRYFRDPEFRDLVVVQGPAGSGKSTFSLRLADRLAAEGLTPVLVRFRDLRLSAYTEVGELLQDAIRVAPVNEHPPSPEDSLFDADVSPTVVILDGWDEVTLTGSTRFKDQIEDWLPRLRQYLTDRPGPPVRLLLTGRPSVAIDRSRILRKETPVLTIRPMRPDQLRDYAARISGRAGWTLDLGRCKEAFESYETWFRQQGGAGADVLGSPLLALLAFRTIAEWPGPTSDLFSKGTALYKALIDITVRHAGKAADSPQGTVHRGGRSLRTLLQRVATVITGQGAESVSFAELAARLEDDDALDDWAEQATTDNALQELVVNFYFKGNPELGCEFLHKSFREYLYAEAIVALLEHLSRGQGGPHAPPERGWCEDFPPRTPQHEACHGLAFLLAPQWLTSDVRDHLFWLIEQAASAEPDRWTWVRDLLVDVYSWWAEGVHLRVHRDTHRGREELRRPFVDELLEDQLPRDDRSWHFTPESTALDAHLGHALLQLTAFVHALPSGERIAGTRSRQSDKSGVPRFRPFVEDDEARRLEARISTTPRSNGRGLAGTRLRDLDLSDQDLDGLYLETTDLSNSFIEGGNLHLARLGGAALTNADLAGATLEGADLTQADLKGANLFHADLANATLLAADLRGAQLMDAQLADAKLWQADLGDADLSTANLAHAVLTDANLLDTNLGNAHLVGADMREAATRGAYLAGANLSSANLTDADLTEADLIDAKLSNTDLTGANLTSANLTNATLADADLTEADLIDANLRNANLTDANLTDADLTDADLTDANLSNANLSNANLSGATLTGATLMNTNLTGADLTDAKVRRSDLKDANLADAILPAGRRRSGAPDRRR